MACAQGEGLTGAEVCRRGAEAASAGAEATKGMKAQAGRASYVPAERLGDSADPGAVAVGIWMGAIAETMESA